MANATHTIELAEPITIKVRQSGQEEREEVKTSIQLREPTLKDLSGVPVNATITLGHLVDVATKCAMDVPPAAIQNLGARNASAVAAWVTSFLGDGR